VVIANHHCSGIVGLLLIPFISFWGRAPVLFWIVFVGTFMCLGTALVQDFTSYYTLRAFMGLFLSGPSSISLAFIRDVFFLHQRARKIGIWFAVFLTSPYFGPMFGYYIIAATGSWRACYWMNFGLDCLVLVCIVLFLDETFYRRDIPRAEQPDRGSRILRLLGIWQIRVHHGYFTPLRNSFFQLFKILLKPVIFPLLIY
jgi:predicted MFS family arabinose efflux permease